MVGSIRAGRSAREKECRASPPGTTLEHSRSREKTPEGKLCHTPPHTHERMHKHACPSPLRRLTTPAVRERGLAGQTNVQWSGEMRSGQTRLRLARRVAAARVGVRVDEAAAIHELQIRCAVANGGPVKRATIRVYGGAQGGREGGRRRAAAASRHHAAALPSPPDQRPRVSGGSVHQVPPCDCVCGREIVCVGGRG